MRVSFIHRIRQFFCNHFVPEIKKELFTVYTYVKNQHSQVVEVHREAGEPLPDSAVPWDWHRMKSEKTKLIFVCRLCGKVWHEWEA